MKVKKIFIIILSAAVFFYSLEVYCTKWSSSDNLPQELFLMQIYDEVLGAYDQNLFWRLEGVYPQFEEEEYKIVCLSDSVSVMYGGHREYPKMLEKLLIKGFPKKTFKVFNAGVPGYSSYQGYRYLKDELMKYKPDFVSINFGPNDHSKALNGLEDKDQIWRRSYLDKCLGWSNFYQCYSKFLLKVKKRIYGNPKRLRRHRVSKDNFKDNLINIVKICRDNKSKAILLTSPYLNRGQDWVEIHDDYNSIIRTVASECNVILVDLAPFFSNKEHLFIDPKHDYVHINLIGSEIIAKELFNAVKNDIR